MLLRVPADHPCLPGHFPGQPVVPGVVILDAVLDAVERQHGPLAALRLPQVKFVRPLLPDQPARIELTAIDAANCTGSGAGHGAAGGSAEAPIHSPAGVPRAAMTSAATHPARWRFRVFHDDALLASGEIAAA